MSKFLMKSVIAGALAGAVAFGGAAIADDKPFSGPDSVAYAGLIWDWMGENKMRGADQINSHVYEGGAPHGAWLETLDITATIDGHTGPLIVKRNYRGGDDIDEFTIMDNPSEFLGAITIMFKREAGYDAENQDWFYAKYLPDGSLDKNPKGMQLAGRVAKGADVGCIACHSGAEGDDFVFGHDRYK